MGPRKYKRRRKLKPEELESFRKSKVDVSKATTKSPTKRTSSRKREQSETLYDDELDDSQNYGGEYDDQDDLANATDSLQQHDDTDNISIDDEPTPLRGESIDESVFNSSAEEEYQPHEMHIVASTSTRKKSPTKKSQSVYSTQNLKVHTVTVAAPPSPRQPRMIHTSKQKVTTITKDGRTAAKTKTVVTRTTNVVEKVAPAQPVTPNRKSARRSTVTSATKKPTATLTNGTQATKSAAAASAKLQNNLLAELSKKSMNYSPDVVSDLEEILRSPIREAVNEPPVTATQTRTSRSGMLRVDYTTSVASTTHDVVDDLAGVDTRPATRSSKRLSNRAVNPAKQSTSRQAAHKVAVSNDIDPLGMFDDGVQLNTLINIKQEKEVSYTMTDENNLFTCEMCSAVFHDRSQLLLHVKVHI